MEIVIQIALLAIGFAMLMKGADWFVEGASAVADKLGIPLIVIGLTIAAMGTSLPEAAVSISAAIRGSAGITIGNIVGSNIMNVLVILGLTGVIRRVSVQKTTIRYEIPFTIVITILLAAMGLYDQKIGRLEGVVLWACMILYLGYLYWLTKHGVPLEDMPEVDKKEPLWKMLLMIVVGIVMIVWGSDISVDAATELAKMFGMSERLIGLTIVAFGTSLPELVTSVTAAIKGKADLAVGNIVGSNIFNILFVVGTTALITPVVYSSDFMVDSLTAIGTMVLLLICVVQKKELGRTAGIVMLAAYAGYFVYLLR